MRVENFSIHWRPIFSMTDDEVRREVVQFGKLNREQFLAVANTFPRRDDPGNLRQLLHALRLALEAKS